MCKLQNPIKLLSMFLRSNVFLHCQALRSSIDMEYCVAHATLGNVKVDDIFRRHKLMSDTDDRTILECQEQ